MPPCKKRSAELEAGAEKGCRQPNLLTSQIRNLKCCCINCSWQKNSMSDRLKPPVCRMALGWNKTGNEVWSCTHPSILNLAASVPLLCIWGSVAHICTKPDMRIAYSSPNPVPVCPGSMTGLPWEMAGNQTKGPSLYSTKWWQTSLGPNCH